MGAAGPPGRPGSCGGGIRSARGGLGRTWESLTSTSPSPSTAPAGTRVLARAGRPAARPAHRRLLGRPGHARPNGAAGPGHDRGRPGFADPRGAGPARRRARRRPRRAADPAHRARADPVVTHTEPFHVVQGDRHAGLREHRTRRRARADLAPPGGGGAVRAPDDARGSARRRHRRAGGPVRRGRRLRRGGAAAVGQLGGRRRDPRRRHRPVRRPRQAALHRLRGRALLRPRARRSPRGRRRASRSSPRSPTATSRSGCVAAIRRHRLRHAARRRRRGRDPGDGPRRAGRGRARRRDRARARRRRGVPRRRPPPRRPSARRGSTGCAGAPQYVSDAHVFVGTPAELADLALEWQAAGLDGFRLRPGVAARRPDADHPRPGAGAAAARRLPHRVRGRHPARAARSAPPRQPLRRRDGAV